MYYKLFDEVGDYQDKTTKEPKNLLSCNIAYTPEGVNVGWDYFDTLEQAMEYYNIELIPDNRNTL